MIFHRGMGWGREVWKNSNFAKSSAVPTMNLIDAGFELARRVSWSRLEVGRNLCDAGEFTIRMVQVTRKYCLYNNC